MFRKLFGLIIIIFFVSVLTGCNSQDKEQTAKDVLQDWRSQDFSQELEPGIEKKIPQSSGETPSGSIACPIKITDYRQRIDGSRIYIEGNVYNYGDESYKNPRIDCVKLYIFFFNKNVDMIREESYNLGVGELRYGEKFPFSVSVTMPSGTERYAVKVRCCNR
ncbi:MAG: hypothetical protein GKC00_00375 [Candidatus Methanofastidiosa archaeon]|nr:hypothetical protein [Candidatus Methanofastidiosa archaeon]